jgi:hypothetical protein
VPITNFTQPLKIANWRNENPGRPSHRLNNHCSNRLRPVKRNAGYVRLEGPSGLMVPASTLPAGPRPVCQGQHTSR